MKRFVTYLYECQKGNKSRNVGFIRINVRGEKTKLEVYIRNLAKGMDNGSLYALIHKERLQGIKLGEVRIENGQSDCHIQVQTSNIEDSEFHLHEIEGVGICFDSGLYLASCWKDEYSEEIIRGEFCFEERKAEEELVITQESQLSDNTIYSSEETILYEKIDLSQIRDLPSPNWHLATNSFLIHGFWNYGHLVLKKGMEEGQKKLALGVPGIYERPEAVMAVLFGFPDFEVVSEKNQETKEGTFGYWFVNLKM